MPDLTTILDTTVLILAIPTAITVVAVIIGAACAGYGIGDYLRNQLIALDQLINTLCGGSPDETISAVAYRKGGGRYGRGAGGTAAPNEKPPLRWRLAYRAINLLFFWQADHCRAAYETEKRGGHLHPSYQE